MQQSVLGGGEVSLLDLTSAYGVFANNGIQHNSIGIIKVTDKFGNSLEQYKDRGKEVLSSDITTAISSILSDNAARAPVFGSNSQLYFPGHDVAVKTGTTQSSRDTWVMGYTPSVALGMWGGNNDNTQMSAQTASIILAPLWHKAMDIALASTTQKEFFPTYTGIGNTPTDVDASSTPKTGSKPILNGLWCVTDDVGNPLVHTILHWVNKYTPNGEPLSNPENDPQYANWEYGVRNWMANNPSSCGSLYRPEAGLFDEQGLPLSD